MKLSAHRKSRRRERGNTFEVGQLMSAAAATATCPSRIEQGRKDI